MAEVQSETSTQEFKAFYQNFVCVKVGGVHGILTAWLVQDNSENGLQVGDVVHLRTQQHKATSLFPDLASLGETWAKGGHQAFVRNFFQTIF